MKSETKIKVNNKIISILFLITLLLVSLFMINTVLAAEVETYSFITKWGTLGSGEGQFNYPSDIAVDQAGNVYVVDTGNSRIQKFSNDGIFLMQWGSNGTDDGQFRKPNRIALDLMGDVYVVDRDNNRVQKFTSEGVFLTKWGSNGTDNGEFAGPSAITVDLAGYVYVSDFKGLSPITYRIQKFSSNGDWITSWANESRFATIMSMSVDSEGYIYVLDTPYYYNRIQKFDSNGVYVKTIKAFGDWDIDPEIAYDIAVDNQGFVYAVGTMISGVKKYADSGMITATWGGPNTRTYSDNSEDGQFRFANGIDVDNQGNVCVADTGNNRVQKFAKVSDSSVRGNWFFDENQGEIVNDNSIYSNDGLIFGASWTSGISRSALNFDGIDDYVSVVDSTSLKPQHFTVKAWVKLKSNGPNHFDSSPLTKGWGVLACSFTNSPAPQAFFGLKFIGDQTWTTLTSTETFLLDRWLPVVYMYDGTFMKIFVNGEEKASLAKIGIIDWSDDELFFGANNWGGYDYTIIDEIRFYDKPYPYPAEGTVTETIRPWWQISLTDDGLINTQQIYERVVDYDRSYISAINSKDYSFILGNLTYRPSSNYPIIEVRVNIVAKNIELESNSINLEIETWGEKHVSPNLEILTNEDYKTYSYTWNLNPATGNNWTKNEIDDLHAGFSVYGNSEVRVTQFYVVIKTLWDLWGESVSNLIQHGDFAQNYSYPWSLFVYDPNNESYSGTLTTTTDTYEGNYSALFTVTNRPSSNTGYIIARARTFMLAPAQEGRMYRLEFVYKGSMIVYPNVYAVDLTYLSSGYTAKKLLEVFNGPICLPTDSWTSVSMVFGPIPIGTEDVELHFDVSTTGEFYFDNVNVTTITSIDYPWIPARAY